MKSKIEAVFDAQKFSHISFSDKELHVVDYTERTNSTRFVEVHNAKPTDIDSLIIHNPTEVNISTSIFKPQCFIGTDGKEPKQCECVMSPTNFTEDAWVLFIEIKDCKAKNISNYHKEAKEKIIANVQLFRDKNILSANKVVYAIVSFPRRNKSEFHNHFIKPSEVKGFIDNHKVIIKGTNKIAIQDKENILV